MHSLEQIAREQLEICNGACENVPDWTVDQFHEYLKDADLPDDIKDEEIRDVAKWMYAHESESHICFE